MGWHTGYFPSVKFHREALCFLMKIPEKMYCIAVGWQKYLFIFKVSGSRRKRYK